MKENMKKAAKKMVFVMAVSGLFLNLWACDSMKKNVPPVEEVPPVEDVPPVDEVPPVEDMPTAEDVPSVEDEPVENEPVEDVPPVEDTSQLQTLRDETQNFGAVCALVYIGYVENADLTAVSDCIKTSAAAEEYTFLKEIPEENTVLLEGGEIYAIIPADDRMQVSISSVRLDSEGAELKEEAVYEGTGAPVIVVCNESDIMPNCRVTLSGESEPVEFSPYISLKDGKPATTAPEGQIWVWTD